MELKEKQQGFIEGSAILLLATALVKILGALFKIPLNNTLGELGVGYFTTAYDLYLPLYALATAGFPVAISQMVASSIERKKYKDIDAILKVAKKNFYIVGGVGTVIMGVLAYPFVHFTGNGDMHAFLPVIMIAPSLAICSALSLYRGYYEGLQNMRPTAISSIIEGLGKLVFGLLLSYLVLVIRGDKTMETLSLAAAAAILGVVLSTVAAFFYLYLKFKKHPVPFTNEELKLSAPPTDKKDILHNLLAVALPIALCALLTNITGLIDVLTVKNQLADAIKNDKQTIVEMYSELIAKNLAADKNFTIESLPTALYGCYRSYAYSIYNLVPILAAALGVGLIPVLSKAWVRGDKKDIKVNIETMIKVSALITFPAGLGIFALSNPILNLLYSNNPIAVEITYKSLAILGIAAIFSGMNVALLSMLEAIGKPRIPLYNIIVGAVIKIVLDLLLVTNPKINILGVSIGTACCYIYIAVANYICLLWFSKVKINAYKTIIKPFIAAVVCSSFAYLIYNLGLKIIDSNKLLTVITIAFSVVVYLLTVIFLKILDKNDIFSMSKGEKLVKTLEKFKVLK